MPTIEEIKNLSGTPSEIRRLKQLLSEKKISDRAFWEVMFAWRSKRSDLLEAAKRTFGDKT